MDDGLGHEPQERPRRGPLALETAIETNQAPSDLVSIARVVIDVAVASRDDAKILKKADDLLAATLQRSPASDDLLVMKAMVAPSLGALRRGGPSLQGHPGPPAE